MSRPSAKVSSKSLKEDDQNSVTSILAFIFLLRTDSKALERQKIKPIGR